MAATSTVEYKVRCSNGRIPNDNYSIEYRKEAYSQYRAKRGGYTIGDYKSQGEAYSALVADTEQHGATGITIN